MSDLIGQSLGRYHILEQLGEGGMAIVYKAYDTRLETDVAVKVIRTENILPSVLERALKRFEREAKALAKLTHPNIVKVMDYGDHEGKPYLVLPYLPGGTLKEKLGKPIPWQEAIQILLPIAEALDYAHSQNMVHRDVKPANILLTERGQPMLTDFGIAKVLDVEETMDLTGTSAAVGTPEYMAPEQATAKTADHRADIYALGIVLYEMITGRKPYSADTPMAVLIMHARDPLPRPSKFVSGIPVAVEKVLIKALAKSPDDRYQSMVEMVTALERLFGGKRSESSKVNRPQKKEKKPKPEKISSQRNWDYKRVAPFVIFTGLALAAVIGFPKLISQPENTPKPILTQTKEIIPEPSITTTVTAKPSATATKNITPTATPLPEEISDIDLVGNAIPMRFVPAGDFIMGSDDWYDDEKPAHQVYVDDYYIDQYEVTNALFAACAESGTCQSPHYPNGFDISEYANHPVNYITWGQAKIYCEWRGADLPTEAQWEKAARGTDGRTYPWGEGLDCSKANYTPENLIPCVGETREVGVYDGGKSPYGVYDLAGNVWEYVNGWYDAYPGNTDIKYNYGEMNRVIRGGAYTHHSNGPRSSLRGYVGGQVVYVGFRCAKDAP
ncbi:MAG: SUMF1/EgtB/PvdO family nonheme iron enzyme [Anaerolineae bacterium]|jgi:serine/threonine protein kinase|nr:SUMF1/EgtB/PvdO family nonheme iron enzyme [Anaerolineae bacterium]MBT7072312.1 SUMF1/EgtB/PvdO family nonheme iron enzyme [Anaerolineae bacterium]MBT7326032.1 SUMF1/EgtB/PvdO family nonheme iron enzyme [Anaerolineae bacterium]